MKKIFQRKTFGVILVILLLAFTLQELPNDTCPICKNPISQYKEVGRQK